MRRLSLFVVRQQGRNEGVPGNYCTPSEFFKNILAVIYIQYQLTINSCARKY